MPALRLIYRSRVSSRQSSDCILHPSRQPCVNCVKLINTNLITRYNRFIFNSCTSTLISSQDTICSYSIRVLPFPFFFLLSPSHLPDGGCTAIILHWLHKFQLVHVCHYNFTLHVSVGCHMSSISSSHNFAILILFDTYSLTSTFPDIILVWPLSGLISTLWILHIRVVTRASALWSDLSQGLWSTLRILFVLTTFWS